MVWLTVGTTVSVGAPYIFWRWHSGQRARARALEDTGEFESPHAAAVIQPGLMCCKAVEQMKGKRILEKDAPSLPLADCDQEKCQCRFRYYNDRRSDDDRRHPFGEATIMEKQGLENDRRQRPDRRKSKKPATPRAYFNDYQS